MQIFCLLLELLRASESFVDPFVKFTQSPTKRRITVTLHDQWILQKEKVLAWLRVGFAIVTVAVILCNPARVARFPWLSYVSLGSFLIYSLTVLYVATRERTLSKIVGLITTSLDLV